MGTTNTEFQEHKLIEGRVAYKVSSASFRNGNRRPVILREHFLRAEAATAAPDEDSASTKKLWRRRRRKKKEKLCTTQRAESRLICRLGAISRCVGAASLPPVSADVDYRVGAERGKNVYIQDGAWCVQFLCHVPYKLGMRTRSNRLSRVIREGSQGWMCKSF